MEDQAVVVFKCIQDRFSDEEEKKRILTFIKLKQREEYEGIKETIEKLSSTQF